jgi:hypothetical protein
MKSIENYPDKSIVFVSKRMTWMMLFITCYNVEVSVVK